MLLLIDTDQLSDADVDAIKKTGAAYKEVVQCKNCQFWNVNYPPLKR